MMLKKRKLKTKREKVPLSKSIKSVKKERKNFVQIRDIVDSDNEEESETVMEVQNGKDEERLKRKEFLKRKIDEMVKKDPKKAKLIPNILKPPTVEEINELKDTENKFHSNLFRMQAEELLQETKVSSKITKRIENWCQEFNEWLINESSIKPSLIDASECTQLHLFPFKVKRELLKNLQLEFSRPEEPAFAIGSQSLDGNTNVIDLCIEMPNKFKGSDHLNLRYHYKRCYYLLELANRLKKLKKLIGDIEIGLLKNDPLKPILIINPNSGRFGKKFKIHVHTICKPDQFKLMRFLPEKNNVRLQCIDETATEREDNTLFPTSHFNFSILADLTLRQNHEFLQRTLTGNQNILDALTLLKIWLKQRNFDIGFYGFDGHLMSMYVAYLVQTKRIYATMSAYQIIRLVWNQMGQTRWETMGITLNKDPNLKPIEHFHKYFDVVFLDVTGYTNICANLSVDLYQKVRNEALNAIKCLDNVQVNCFQTLFLQKYTINLQYDHILVVKGDFFLQKLIKSYADQEDQLNYFGSYFPCVRKMLLKILRQGLGNRVLDIVPFTAETNSWPLSEKPRLKHESITICLAMSSEHAFTVVDRGPQANETELAEAFRKFWGCKSELRRFKDGAITESCVWGAMKDPLAKKRLICEKICRHLLESHFSVVGDTNLLYLSNQLEVAVSRCDQLENLTNEEMALNCIKSFDSLSRYLRDLNDLPLDIVSVLGIDPIFRYCDVDFPMENAKFEYKKSVFLATKVCHGIIQLAPSGKWPDDLAAIKHLKAAFHLHLAKVLREQNTLYHARGQMDYVDILYEGYLFRLQIVHPKEIVLMKQHQEKARIVLKDTNESLQMEIATYILPKLTSSLHALHLQQPAFGTTVRLAKRWLNSQMLDGFVWPDECTELIVASIFLKANLERTPVQPQAGFFKFLHFMAQTDFNTDMVVVNFNDELSSTDLEVLDTKFINARDSFPPLFIVTSCDFSKHTVWTKKAPIAPVLARCCLLAQSTLNTLNDNLFDLDMSIVQHIFTPSISGYDVVIQLDRSYRLPTNLVDIECFANRKITFIEKRPPTADFNPYSLYLRKLREAYNHFAVFFYDGYGGDRIAVLWKPHVASVNQFNLTNINGSCLTKDKSLKTNKAEIIKDFKLIGDELVLDIVIKEE